MLEPKYSLVTNRSQGSGYILDYKKMNTDRFPEQRRSYSQSVIMPETDQNELDKSIRIEKSRRLLGMIDFKK